jgi:uncharacterized protein with GYD domain
LRATFDGAKAMDAMRQICEVSEFIDPETPLPESAEEVGRYLSLSHRRLDVVAAKFANLGYEAAIQTFDFRGHQALNAVFSRGKGIGQTLLIVGHHDYCAGLGAEDDATALAVMLELARCLDDEKSRIAFASFDLEEVGLIGSRHYARAMSAKDVDRLAGVIALECVGSGQDVVICDSISGAVSDPFLVSSLHQAATDTSQDAFIEGFDWFSADHVAFAERGVSAAEVCSYNAGKYTGGPSPDVNVAHSALDMPHSIRTATLTAVGQMLQQFVRRWELTAS